MSQKIKFSQFISDKELSNVSEQDVIPEKKHIAFKPKKSKLKKINIPSKNINENLLNFNELEKFEENISPANNQSSEPMDDYVKVLSHSFKPKEVKQPDKTEANTETPASVIKEDNTPEEEKSNKEIQEETKEQKKPASRLSSLESTLANIQRHLKKLSAQGPGSGEVKLKRLDDVDMRNGNLPNSFLKFDPASKNFILNQLSLSLLTDVDLLNLEDGGYLQYNIDTQKWEVTQAVFGGLSQEQVEDIVGAMLLQGVGITLAYNDLAGILRIDLDYSDVITDIDRDVDQNVTSITRSSGVTKTFTYDTAGDLDTMTINTGINIFFFQANYDVNGNFSGWTAI